MRISESRQSFTYGIHSDIQMPSGYGRAAAPPYHPSNKGELAHMLAHTLTSLLFSCEYAFLAKATTETHAWASIPTRETFIPNISCHNTQWPSLFLRRSYRAQQINKTALVDLQHWREIKSRNNEEGTETQTARWVILEEAKWSRRRLERSSLFWSCKVAGTNTVGPHQLYDYGRCSAISYAKWSKAQKSCSYGGGYLIMRDLQCN